MGTKLSKMIKKDDLKIDVVIPVPETSRHIAITLAHELNVKFREGFIKNRYIGRTFIEPRQAIRHFGVKLKLNPVRRLLKGKRVVVVDDSIVRGTTSKKIVKMLREVGGAKEVHLKISSPPTIGPCFYGIDTPTRKELIASSHRVEEIRKFVTSDSLTYLDIEGLLEVVPSPEKFCTACFDNNYPVFTPEEKAEQIALFI